MKSLQANQKGIAHLALLLAAVVVVAVAVVGWRVMQNHTVTPVASKAAVSSKLSSKADVTAAAGQLDATSVDSDLDTSQLDSDLNSLL